MGARATGKSTLLRHLFAERALARILDSRYSPGTSAFGQAFEAWAVLEIQRHNSYAGSPFRLEYFSDGRQEIDLILSGRQQKLAIEIKSSERVSESHIAQLAQLSQEIGADQAWLLSRDPIPRRSQGVQCQPWHTGLLHLFCPRD